MDLRVEKAQRLLWEIEALKSLQHQRATRAVLPQLREMAALHRERALELLPSGDAEGWTDLFAAVTAWGEAGARSEAEQLLETGRQLARSFSQGQENIVQQLNDLEAWLDEFRVVPSLGEFGAVVPLVASVPA